MTNRRSREQGRAVRRYQREHPGLTLDQARQAVAARSGRQQDLPARIPDAPLPRPAERLESYVQRVAAAAGVQRHRAMELLGLEPGASATERLAELTGHLPEHTVRALTAATGMTAGQARALTTPSPAVGTAAATAHEALLRMAGRNLTVRHYRRGGEGKTSTSIDFARMFAERVGLIDVDPQPALERPGPALSPLFLGDTSSPFIGQLLPVRPGAAEAPFGTGAE